MKKENTLIKKDISTNWAKALNFIPAKGEIILYEDLNKIKIGDGVTKVNDLDWYGDYNYKVNDDILIIE